jgi:hypothetical protein
MSEANQRPTGQGYKFGGAKAKAIKARLRAMAEERARTGRVSMFDIMQSAIDPNKP